MDSILLKNDNYTSTGKISAIVLVYTIEAIVGLTINSFILIISIARPKTLLNPFIMLLNNFVILNLVFDVLYIPSIIVSAIAGGWSYGQTQKEKYGMCQFMGIILLWYALNSILTLAAMSVTRFLFIVKPLLYKRFVRKRTTVITVGCIWVLSGIPGLLPLMGVGVYVYDVTSMSCVPSWPNSQLLVASIFMTIFGCFAIIMIFTTWTFCFTIKYLRRNRNILTIGSADSSTSIFNRKMCKLLGIFGTLLLVTCISYLPLLIKFVIGVTEVLEGAYELNIGVLVFLALNTILNPAIQSYFRKELWDFLTTQIGKVKQICHMKCFKVKTETQLPDNVSSTTTFPNIN